MTITLTSTNATAELGESSLSGNLTDYQIKTSRPGEIIITAINSYKDRKTKAELKEIVEEQRKLEEAREILRRSHVYTKILAGKPLAT